MTNSGIAQRQAEIDARVAAVTPGEWVAIDGFVFTSFVQETSRGSLPLFAQGRVVLTAGNADAEFCANAKPDLEWQRERIKALEAEVALCKIVADERSHETSYARLRWRETLKRVADLENAAKWARRWKQEAKRQSARRESLANHAREIVSVGESKTHATKMESLSARRWARRWKELARERHGHESYYQGRLLYYRERLEGKENRIAALENAAKSCATCLYHVSDLDPIPDYCNEHCRKPDIRGAGWVFNEKRWAPKGSTDND